MVIQLGIEILKSKNYNLKFYKANLKINDYKIYSLLAVIMQCNYFSY